MTVLRRAGAMKRSIVAFVLALGLGFLSMGALGMLLWYPVMPVLAPLHGDPNDWHGDWVWPTIIAVGMVWSFSFLVAGWINLRLEGARIGRWPRRLAYIAVLWLGALLSWALLLSEPFRAN